MRAFIYTMDINESLIELDSNASLGLTNEAAAERLARSGKNELEAARKKSLFRQVISRFKDILICLLIAASVVSAIISDGLRDMIIIPVIIIINVIIAVTSENRAAMTLDALKKASGLKARVKRENQIETISASDLVIGDIVILKRGDIVPADLRLIESNNLRIDESSVTAITTDAEKDANLILGGDAPLGNRVNLAFMSSIVIGGKGTGVVYAIGKNTEIGKNAIITANTEVPKTPAIDILGTAAKSFGILFMIICAAALAVGILYDIFGIGVPRGIPELTVMLMALCLAVSLKGITATATAIMASGIHKMDKTKTITKSLHAAEVLGSTTVICTGKTGTFTHNEMMVTQVADCENTYEVTGVGYKPKGHVIAEIMITRNIALMSEIVVLCNDAGYDKKHAQITGDPTEGAMLVYGVKLGHDKHILDAARPRIHEIPFDSTRKMMSTYNLDGDRVIMYTKGAAEEIIKNSSYVYLDGEIVFMSDAIRTKLLAQNDEYAAGALRVLACAYKVYNSKDEIDNDETDLIYVGMMALSDPPREEIVTSIKQCRSAGISVKMMTGDHKNTAKAIAAMYGLVDTESEILSGNDLDALTDEELIEKVRTVNIFARVTPEHKVRIVSAIKAGGNSSVAVTGDDFDDVPAINKADIGIAMGITGCDAVNDAADIILSDDSFGSIITAVEQSRTMYANIRRAVTHILSRKMGLLLFVFLMIVFGFPLPLTGGQILLLSLLTGSLSALAIGMEGRERDIMRRRPRNPEETVLNRRVISLSITRAVVISTGGISAYLYGFYVAVAPEGFTQHILAMSMCLFTLAAGGLLAVYSSKNDNYLLAGTAVLTNKFVNTYVLISLLLLIVVFYMPGPGSLFSVAALQADQVLICSLLILLTIVSFEISKPGSRWR